MAYDFIKRYGDFQNLISTRLVGFEKIAECMLIALMVKGHVLLEGPPGVAKTMLAKTFAALVDAKFKRIQFTPDLLPTDILGTVIYDPSSKKFSTRLGPIFTNILLADEINRASPKTQAALLEAMEESQVTIEGTTYPLDEPFMVIATQNPIEQEGSLALTETVLVDSQIKTGAELLALAQDKCVLEYKNGIKLYDTNAWVLSLNASGRLEKQKCLLYTLPYTDEMVVITTKTGKRLKVTKNHPFLVNENGRLKWKKAEDLTKQDYLVNPARIEVEPQRVMSHHEAIARMSQKPIPSEIPFDEDFAFWIAFLLSEGYIGEKSIEVWQKNYPEALDRFVSICKKYGFKPSVRMNRGCRYAKVYSKPLVEYLNLRFGITSGKNRDIPSWFIGLPPEMNREFLKTFISLESSLRDNRIVLTQKSAKNVNIIAHMLLREGILLWIRHDSRIFRAKIQGKDCINFLKNIGWVSEQRMKDIYLERIPKSSFRVVPMERKVILKLVELLGLSSFHTLKGRGQSITARPWYGSYRGIKEGEVVMAVDSLKFFIEDMKAEIGLRKTHEFAKLLDTDPRRFSAGIGTSITEIAQHLDISKNQVWKLYSEGNAACAVQAKQFLAEQRTARMAEAESLLKYCEVLLSEDVYYDRIKAINYEPSDGLAFGLSVPGLQNYVAGFGGCGINHNTYPLPEAQLDRFLFKIDVNYPSEQDEVKVLHTKFSVHAGRKIPHIFTKSECINLNDQLERIFASERIMSFASAITNSLRKNPSISWGPSPRASISCINVGKALALLSEREYVVPGDITRYVNWILNHRIGLGPEYALEGVTNTEIVKKNIEGVDTI